VTGFSLILLNILKQADILDLAENITPFYNLLKGQAGLIEHE
jgi:hypothetical protein